MRARRLLPALTALLFAAAFTTTHIPISSTPNLGSHSDKLFHALGYFALATSLLLTLRSRPRPPSHPTLLTLASLTLYAVLDESTQPLVGRHFELLDIAADILGATLAAALLNAFHKPNAR